MEKKGEGGVYGQFFTVVVKIALFVVLGYAVYKIIRMITGTGV